MGYTKPPQQAMGDVGGTIVKILNVVGSTAVAAANVAADPYFPEIVCRVGQLASIKAKRPVQACMTTPEVASSLGLNKIMTPLRAYTYAEANPWVYPVGIAAVVGIPFLLGYLVGKK